MEDGGGGGVVGDAAEAIGWQCYVEPVVADGLAGIDGDVEPLADGDEEVVGGVGVDGDQVCCDHGHGVVDERNLEVVLQRGVDEAQAVALVGGEGDVCVSAGTGDRVDVGAVDEDIVAGRWAVIQGERDEVISRAVVVVGDWEDAKVDVIWQGGRAVDLNGAQNSVAVLSRKVRVVPGCPVLCGEERVHLASALGRNWTLSHAVGSVLDVRAQLPEAMPVYRGPNGKDVSLVAYPRRRYLPYTHSS